MAPCMCFFVLLFQALRTSPHAIARTSESTQAELFFPFHPIVHNRKHRIPFILVTKVLESNSQSGTFVNWFIGRLTSAPTVRIVLAASARRYIARHHLFPSAYRKGKRGREREKKNLTQNYTGVLFHTLALLRSAPVHGCFWKIDLLTNTWNRMPEHWPPLNGQHNELRTEFGRKANRAKPASRCEQTNADQLKQNEGNTKKGNVNESIFRMNPVHGMEGVGAILDFSSEGCTFPFYSTRIWKGLAGSWFITQVIIRTNRKHAKPTINRNKQSLCARATETNWKMCKRTLLIVCL